MDKFAKTSIEDASDISVEMVKGRGAVQMWFNQVIEGFSKLRRELKISPKCHMEINKPGFTATYVVESVSTTINIGEYHSALLIMTKEAFESFVEGAKIETVTVEDFKRRYIKPKKSGN